MITYISQKQLTIEEFKTPFQAEMRADNRWVKLSKIVPWDAFASLYVSKMDIKQGRPGIHPRIVLGALIIKHLEKLEDRGVIAAIQENIYMQFFVGMAGFNPDPVFSASLFVDLRKRVGNDVFDKLNTELIKAVSDTVDSDILQNSEAPSDENNDNKPQSPNKGKLQMDATVADQYITYPTDSKILNASRKRLEKMIDALYELNGKQGSKPRTYRRKMDVLFLDYSKKKRKSKAVHRKMNRKLLECVKRNLAYINSFLDSIENNRCSTYFPLGYDDQKILWVIQNAYRQQKQMYDEKTNSCKDRIVNIWQPHVRPVPRGKIKSKIEFGSKLGVSLDNGFARIDTLSWHVYNEAGDLKKQVNNYLGLHGYYPELVLVDKIYATRENRKWLKERNIRITAPALGRKSKASKNESYRKKKQRKAEASERNQIEGKFGQGKNGYNLNQIRAKLKSTSESWIGAIFFIMNLKNLDKIGIQFLFQFKKWLKKEFQDLLQISSRNYLNEITKFRFLKNLKITF